MELIPNIILILIFVVHFVVLLKYAKLSIGDSFLFSLPGIFFILWLVIRFKDTWILNYLDILFVLIVNTITIFCIVPLVKDSILRKR